MFNSIYWLMVLGALLVSIEVVYNYNTYIEKHGKRFIYVVLTILYAFICIGIVFNVVKPLVPENIPYKAEAEYETNASLPYGMYYLGAEIVNSSCYIENAEYHYIYEFGIVDDEKYNGYTYEWETAQCLDENIPYLLTMDSLDTNKLEDDQIVVVWSWVY